MRVLLIDVNCKYSSTGKIVYDLFQNIKQNGDEAAVCYGRGEQIDEEGIYKFGLDWETNIHAGLARITGLNGCFSYFSTKRLLKYIDEFKPDVIHIHELHAYFVNQKSLINYIKQHNIPLVWTFHCEYMYTGKCGYAYDCNKWKSECRNCPAVKDYPSSLWFDQTTKMFHDKEAMLKDLNFSIVTPSQWLADRVKQSFLKDKSIYVIHNGINTESVFYPRSPKEISLLHQRYQLDDRKVVLAVAPDIMNERKGGETVLGIAEKMPALQFVMVGANEDTKYSDNVLILSKTKDQNELAQWYSLANVFLICSQKETFSLTCAEALACGTPIAGYKSGAPETVFPPPYAIFTDYGDSKALEDAIIRQIDTSYNRNQICIESKAKYSKKVMCEKYIDEYKKVSKI